MITVIREEKDKNLADFTAALERIRAAGDFDANSVSLSGTSHGSTKLTGDLTVTKATDPSLSPVSPDGPQPDHIYGAIGGTPKSVKRGAKKGGKGKK